MVTVNAGGVSETVFESELFGHVRGAFTDARADRVGRFELADGGTLFLDEIANVPPSQQAKLLRVHRGRRIRAPRLVAHAAGRCPHPLGHQRRHRRRGGGRAFPSGSALPAQHNRNRPAAAARSARRHPVAGDALSRAACAALSKESERLRQRRDGRAAAASMAGQRARARACDRAGGADGRWS